MNTKRQFLYSLRLKFQFTSIIVFVSLFSSLAQSKNEQIFNLSRKLDSLNYAVNLKRIESNSREKALGMKLDSIDWLINELNDSIMSAKELLDNRNYKIKAELLRRSELKSQLWILSDSNSKIRSHLDSLLFDQSDFSLEHEMIEVQGGNFIMTKNDALIKSSNEQYESVPVSSFSIGKYEVTQAQWWSVMGNNPSCFGDCANCPVESVSWDDVQEFVQKLNLKTGKSYRLPTEAEWEYAAKGGVKTKGYLNYGANDLRPIAWCGEYTMSTHSVGTRQANELGIYDMSGNVSEWCSDSYLLKNYSSLALVRNHALRGCAWDYREYKCRAAYWLNAPSDAKSNCYGLRLVLPVSP